MADYGSHQRKPDFRTAVEDVKALATVLVMKLESVLGRRLKLRSPAVLAAIGVVATLVLALVVVIVLLRTGDADAVSNNAALIGALVALGGVFTAQIVGIALDDRRTHEARDLETQRAGETALQNYFEAVGELLIEKSLHRASPGDTLSAMVRAQTLSVLEGLDPNRKRILLSFLYESGLIYERKLVVSLALAKLNRANLGGAYLLGANLSRANLIGANLKGANLSEANLKDSFVYHANLSDAYLVEVDLSRAHLNNVNLSNAYLIDANLRKANLSDADLSDADLSDADLSDALLSDANLSDSILFNTNLSGTMGITSEELKQQARFLDGAIMPDGSKHP